MHKDDIPHRKNADHIEHELRIVTNREDTGQDTTDTNTHTHKHGQHHI